jgi:hypothetical protein
MLFYAIKKRFKGALVYRFNSSIALRTWLKKKCNTFTTSAESYFVRKAKKYLKTTLPSKEHAIRWAKGVKVLDTRPSWHR